MLLMTVVQTLFACHLFHIVCPKTTIFDTFWTKFSNAVQQKGADMAHKHAFSTGPD